jgi:hypothetical protein
MRASQNIGFCFRPPSKRGFEPAPAVRRLSQYFCNRLLAIANSKSAALRQKPTNLLELLERPAHFADCERRFRAMVSAHFV